MATVCKAPEAISPGEARESNSRCSCCLHRRTANRSRLNFLLHGEFPPYHFRRTIRQLGKELTWADGSSSIRRLSSDESTSCASCHNPDQAFADNQVTSRGIGGKKGNRNTPTVINTAFQPYQFWDGRASSLEDQALLPLENPDRNGIELPIIVDRLNQLPQYRDAFRRVFDAPVTRKNLAQALASFERTILAGDSAYDQYAAGNPTALSQKAAEGMKLFEGKAHCRLCHQGYNFSDGVFHNLGVGWDETGFADEGRKAVTGIVKDRGAFKTPTLRQVAQTDPTCTTAAWPAWRQS